VDNEKTQYIYGLISATAMPVSKVSDVIKKCFGNQHSFVDTNRIYLLGAGFSVMPLITQYPTVFRAAIDILEGGE